MAEIVFDEDEEDDNLWIEDPYDEAVSPSCPALNRIRVHSRSTYT